MNLFNTDNTHHEGFSLIPGLFDYEFQLRKIKSKNPPLQRLDELIDWEMFRAPG